MVLLETQPVPLELDGEGVLRVGKTRVRLDTIIYAFQQGYTAEEIVSQYPAVGLGDIYALLAYYLNNRKAVDAYLDKRQSEAEEVREAVTTKPEYQAFREQLIARIATQ